MDVFRNAPQLLLRGTEIAPSLHDSLGGLDTARGIIHEGVHESIHENREINHDEQAH